MKITKVVHLTSVHSPFDIRIFHKECKTLARAGFKVSLIAQHDKEEVVDGVNIIPLPKAKNRFERMLKLPFDIFRLAIKQKADIYHFHDPELLQLGVLLKIFTTKKVIYDVHEDYPKQILSKFYIPKIVRKSVALAVRFAEYFSSKFFDAIITATDSILERFSRQKKAFSLKNFPIIDSFLSVKQQDNKSNIFNLVYVGGLAEIRGITQIIQALECINSELKLKLTLCGEFCPINYEEIVRRLKGFEKVDYLGKIDHEKIPNILNMSDAGIVCFLPEPNHIDSMPNKTFEYMIAGLPLIASNFPLWKKIVEDNNCGMCVDPLNQNDIAKAIEYLIENPKEAKKMGENGRKAVQERYNWEQESRKLLELYEKIL